MHALTSSYHCSTHDDRPAAVLIKTRHYSSFADPIEGERTKTHLELVTTAPAMLINQKPRRPTTHRRDEDEPWKGSCPQKPTPASASPTSELALNSLRHADERTQRPVVLCCLAACTAVGDRTPPPKTRTGSSCQPAPGRLTRRRPCARLYSHHLRKVA